MFKELRNFGLSEKEAKVYVATLELGKATVQDIARKANVNRATTYVQLESLKNRGLVSKISTDKKTFFMSEPPENVQKLIEKEKMEVLFKEKEFSKILPNLQAIYNVTDDRPSVRFYEEKKGIENFVSELLKSYQNELMLLTTIKQYEDRKIVSENIIRMSKNFNIFRLAYVSDEKYEDFEELLKDYKNIKLKFIPRKKINIDMELLITENKIWIYREIGGCLGIVIEDKLLTSSFKNLFNFIWESK